MPLVGLGLYELLALLVGIGLALVSRPASGGFVNWLGNVLRNVPLVGGVFSLDQILKLDRWITHEIGKATQALTRRGSAWFAALTHYQDVVGYWSLYWPVGLMHVVRHLVERVIPHQITARTAPLAKRLDATEAQTKANTGVAHSTTKVIKGHDTTVKVTQIQRVAMPHASEWDWIHHNFKALQHAIAGTAAAASSVALPHAIAWPVPHGLTIKNLRKRMHRIEALLGVTGAAALVARAIGGISADCVRKGNIAKTARRICGLDANLLDSLLLDSLAIVGAISVVEFAEGLRSIEDEAVAIMGRLVKEFPST